MNFLMRDELIAVKLGEYLQQKRKERGLSQGHVSRVLGYSSPQFISNMERGLCCPPFSALKQMAELYEIDSEEITSTLIRFQSEFLAKAFPSGKLKASRRPAPKSRPRSNELSAAR